MAAQDLHDTHPEEHLRDLAIGDDSSNARVLSIQSHVVSGYVGNRSAVFPLQVLGFDVDVVNTVQLSNHSGYPSTKGISLNENGLQDLYDGLRANNLIRHTHLLSGFVRSKALLEKIAHVATELKRLNPDLIYVCDPVMGDYGKMYVPVEMLETYKSTVLPLADIITPNQFEAELLTGMTIRTEKDALDAIDKLHTEYAVPVVIISSSDLGNEEVLIGFGSCIRGHTRKQFRMTIPKLPADFRGTGDLFAALVLAWVAKTGDVQQACELAISTLQAVLKRTLSFYNKNCSDPKPCWRHLDIRLIQSRHDIENPDKFSTTYCSLIV
ncbi:hypothetical protein RvY_13251 [Ramazzottius varieornatus]|uniref:Pyridoxal kinase n=1 Tax=Ramazzottius varieornatus TaxID=947166 RepID=A0A1D1VM82_RAMVA|nr:hypothetical protein RvY_13251 [Ramazzottius varieornatus]